MKQAKQNIIRLYKYRDTLMRLKPLGYKKIFSDDLAESAGVTATQVRKDFSIFGLSGNKRAGYNVDELIAQLNGLLGKNEPLRVVVVGAGNIGRALMHYDGFNRAGIRIEAVFDIDTVKQNPQAKPPVMPLEALAEFVQREQIAVGIIAVPHFAAQQVVEKMIEAGMKGALNFAPVNLKTPEDFFLNDVDLHLELEVVGYFSKIFKKTRNGI